MVEGGPRWSFSDIALKEIIEGKLTFETKEGYDETDGLSLYIEAGDASIATISELLLAISNYHEASGGGKLTFEPGGEYLMIRELAQV